MKYREYEITNDIKSSKKKRNAKFCENNNRNVKKTGEYIVIRNKK